MSGWYTVESHMMTSSNRRVFLQALAISPLILRQRVSQAAGEGAPRALVIGNGAYPQARLVNPTHDAKAMHALLGLAGFDAELLLEGRKESMIESIERFGARLQSTDTRLAVFYYAGHGAQLEWRNYLLPVDVSVNSSAALKAGCIDLGMLLDQLARAQRRMAEKTFVIILDACRDNPFGDSFRLPHKGLSQFDAPVGSLLAYATAPGNVASDGTGQNGLYTGHLVKELSRKEVRIEDALKRVRLNVRLASEGEQIPWESTSLESDVFIFPHSERKLSDEQIEQQIEEEIAYWGRIRTSRNVEEWAEYLRRYPNGRFSEIAQARLGRLLAAIHQLKHPAAQPAPDRNRPETTPPGKSAAEVTSAQADELQEPLLKDGEAIVPPAVLAAVSHNPFSAGRFPLGRKFTVGDRYAFRNSDLLTGIEERKFRNRVTRVDEDNDRVECNHGKLVLDLMGNTVENIDNKSDVPQQFFPAELQVGKRWTSLQTIELKSGQFAGTIKKVELDVRIPVREIIRVPAGEFNAFRIEAQGWSMGGGRSLKIEVKCWVVPGINFFIRRERIKRRGNKLIETLLTELVAMRQAAVWLPD